jgi:Family of unknown function (DUF5372)
VTHPFHPLAGRDFEFIACRQNWGEDRVISEPHTHGLGAGPGEEGCMIDDRWGVSTSEILRSYPCDAFVASPTLQAWRGVRVEAPAAAVWPWVAQVRIAPYS